MGIPTNTFYPIPGSSKTVVGAAVTSLGRVDATKPQQVRLAWTGGPGTIAIGSAGVVQTDATRQVLLPLAAGVEVFSLDSSQTHIAQAAGLTLNMVLGM